MTIEHKTLDLFKYDFPRNTKDWEKYMNFFKDWLSPTFAYMLYETQIGLWEDDLRVRDIFKEIVCPVPKYEEESYRIIIATSVNYDHAGDWMLLENDKSFMDRSLRYCVAVPVGSTEGREHLLMLPVEKHLTTMELLQELLLHQWNYYFNPGKWTAMYEAPKKAPEAKLISTSHLVNQSNTKH